MSRSGCKYCNGIKYGRHFLKEFKIDNVTIRVCVNGAMLQISDKYNPHQFDNIKINRCPMCGAYLLKDKKTWDEIEAGEEDRLNELL